MTTSTLKLPFYVNIVEYERGWGSKVEDTLDFNTYKEASDYIETYNTKYNPPLPNGGVPDWYMVAQGPYTRTSK